MLSDILIIAFLLVILASSSLLALQRLSQCRHLTILDVQKVLRPVHSTSVQQLLDPRIHDTLRSVFSRRHFEDSQLMSLYEIREYLLRMSHNSYVFLVWANTELWRETKFKPGMDDRETYIDLSRKLHAAALEFRIYAICTLVRINFWMIFRIRPWSPFPAPRLVELRETAGVRFYASYQRLQEAVGALCLAYGQEFYDEMMAVI
jgi:hypothetical protein